MALLFWFCVHAKELSVWETGASPWWSGKSLPMGTAGVRLLHVGLAHATFVSTGDFENKMRVEMNAFSPANFTQCAYPP
eukprot:366029-Chlamydomonas_euryale.AAC.7